MSWAAPEDIYLSTSLASYLDSKFFFFILLIGAILCPNWLDFPKTSYLVCPYLYSEDYFSQFKFIGFSFLLKFIFRMYYNQRIEFIVLCYKLLLLDSNICGLCYMLQITVISLVMVERVLWNRLFSKK